MSDPTKPYLYQPGQSGNPAGRPKGSLNKSTLACKALLEDHREDLINKGLELALKGHPRMLAFFLDRIIDKKISKHLNMQLATKQYNDQITSILEQLDENNLDSEQANNIVEILAKAAKIDEVYEQRKEIEALKQEINNLKRQH